MAGERILLERTLLAQLASFCYLIVQRDGALATNAGESPSIGSLIEMVRLHLLPHRILIDIWLSMAEGPPIDEQRALRQAAAQATNVQLPASTSNVVLPAEDSDDDRDPNNAIFNATGPSGDPYEDLEDDDDDDD